MKTLIAALAVALVMTPVFGAAATGMETVVAQAGMTPTEKDAQSRLTAAGYSDTGARPGRQAEHHLLPRALFLDFPGRIDDDHHVPAVLHRLRPS